MPRSAWVFIANLLRLPCLCFVFATTGALLSACSNSGEGEVGSADSAEKDGAPGIRDVYDPAMEKPAAERGPEQGESTLARPVRIDKLPTEITLNETQDQIFLPGRGWLPVTEFWDLYENHPGQLPDNLNLQSVHRIRLTLAEQDNDQS